MYSSELQNLLNSNKQLLTRSLVQSKTMDVQDKQL